MFGITRCHTYCLALNHLIILGKTFLYVNAIYYIYFEITGYSCNLIGCQRSWFFALNCIFFSANENEAVKQNNQSDFKVFLN